MSELNIKATVKAEFRDIFEFEVVLTERLQQRQEHWVVWELKRRAKTLELAVQGYEGRFKSDPDPENDTWEGELAEIQRLEQNMDVHKKAFDDAVFIATECHFQVNKDYTTYVSRE